jgi:uncharacterized membrane protein YphA (DoxX/SURF4 family)
MRILTLISRILVGVLFIISGMIKANDPIGFSIKLQEYFNVFGTPVFNNIALGLAVFICVFEVVLGVATLTGSKMKPVAWSLLLMIVFFTFLTFYSAYFNKVTDCGCFGDAVKLTPWQSFTKDLILLVFIVIIFINRNRIHSSLSPIGDWTVLGVSTALVTWFSVYCINHLPVVDFRPFAIGKNIPEQMIIPEGAKQDKFETKLYYKNLKTGEVKGFTTENYPWQDTLNWAWDTTVTELVEKGYHPPIHDFHIASLDGSTDITEDVLNNPDYSLLVVSYDISKAEKSAQEKLNKLADECGKRNINVIGLTSSTYRTVDDFRHEHNIMYEFYNVDETTLKTMIRSNPGLILIKKGVVIDMWHANDIPEFGEFKQKYLNGR